MMITKLQFSTAFSALNSTETLDVLGQHSHAPENRTPLLQMNTLLPVQLLHGQWLPLGTTGAFEAASTRFVVTRAKSARFLPF